MTRGSPVASWYCSRTLSMTMRGHQSLLLAGPIMPSAAWWVERPVDVFLRFGFETSVVEQVGERDETIEEVWAAFPGFSGATEPAAVGADVGPGFVEVSAEAVGLNLQLIAKPAGWANCAERERIKGASAARGRDC